MEEHQAEAQETETVEDAEGDDVHGHSMAISANFSIDIGGVAMPKPGDVRVPGTEPGTTTDPLKPPTRS